MGGVTSFDGFGCMLSIHALVFLPMEALSMLLWKSPSRCPLRTRDVVSTNVLPCLCVCPPYMSGVILIPANILLPVRVPASSQAISFALIDNDR